MPKDTKMTPEERQLKLYQKTGILIHDPSTITPEELKLINKLESPYPSVLDPGAHMPAPTLTNAMEYWPSKLDELIGIPKDILSKPTPEGLNPWTKGRKKAEMREKELMDIMVGDKKYLVDYEMARAEREFVEKKEREMFRWASGTKTSAPAAPPVMNADYDEEWEFDLASGKLQVGDVVRTNKGEICTITPSGPVVTAHAYPEDDKIRGDRPSGPFYPMRTASSGKGLLDQISAPDHSQKILKSYTKTTLDMLDELTSDMEKSSPEPLIMHTGGKGAEEFKKAMKREAARHWSLADDGIPDDLLRMSAPDLHALRNALRDEEQVYDMEPDDIEQKLREVESAIEAVTGIRTYKGKSGHTIHVKRNPLFDGADPHMMKTNGIRMAPLESGHSIFVDMSKVKPESKLMPYSSTPGLPNLGDGPAGGGGVFKLKFPESWRDGAVKAFGMLTGLDKREREK